MHLITAETPCLAAFAIRPHGTLYSPLVWPSSLVTSCWISCILWPYFLPLGTGYTSSQVPCLSQVRWSSWVVETTWVSLDIRRDVSNRGLISLLWSGDSNAHSIHLKAFLSGFERLFLPESYVKKDWLQMAHFLVIQLLQKKKKEKATWKALALDEE